MHRPLLTALLAAALLPTLGCVAYNDPCQPLVEDPEAVVGYLGEDVFMERPFTRHSNHALGQAAADAFRHAEDGSSRPAELGIINGGALRAEGLCVNRRVLRKGPLTNGLLHEIMLFENQVVTVDLTEAQLVAMMEQSVAGLSQAAQPIASAPGAFLHLSEGSSLRVDCERPRGERVRELVVNGRTVAVPARTDPSIRYRVAMSSFIASGGDGYGAILGDAAQDPGRNPVTASGGGGTDANITAAYLRTTYPNAAQALREAPRLLLDNCARPVSPAR